MAAPLRQAGAALVGYLGPGPDPPGPAGGVPALGPVGAIARVLGEQVVDEVVFLGPPAAGPAAEPVLRACREEGIPLHLALALGEAGDARVALDWMEGVPFLTVEPVPRDDWQLAAKRALDVALVCLALPLLLPVMALVALAIRLDSPGPVFFVQERVGLGRRRFRMVKFRTMRQGSEAEQAALEGLNQADRPIFKIFGDPRVTRVGRVLRRTSLDELPQVWNVLAGSMSLVGPRPLSGRDADRLERGRERQRFCVKPGMTGLWQVSGRSTLPAARWLELDLHYVHHWSLALDLRILLRTLPAVVRGTGAA
jgi:exopolysaccharide biosynthesis polyprenyl glycosylphosphotransferase